MLEHRTWPRADFGPVRGLYDALIAHLKKSLPGYRVDMDQNEFISGDRRMTLTKQEADMLAVICLTGYADYRAITSGIWGHGDRYINHHDPMAQMRVLKSRVNRKFENEGIKYKIITHYGMGLELCAG